MTPTWPLEALKAQAVAARTFAVRNLGRHGADGFDLCDAPHCQAYGGVQAEHPSSTAAVRATNQLVLRYFGELVQAFYHSSSGGSTENAGNVWGQDLPYLTQVEEGIELAGPYGFWEEILSMAELGEKLVKAGFPVGQVRSIEIAQKSPSGRVNSVNVFGTGGTTLIAGTDLRQALNLKSTLFDIKDGATVSQNGEEIEIQVLGSLGSAGALFVNSGTYVVGSKGIELIESRLAANVPSRGGSGKSIVLHGSGYGHGVGMSQWGAKYLAEQPSFGGDDSFKQILTHYYNGVTIEPY